MLSVKQMEFAMPEGPNGEKRPAGATGLAMMIGKIATGEVQDVAPDDGKDPAAKALGAKGGKARAVKMSPDERAEAARKAADIRWAAKCRVPDDCGAF